MTAVGLEQARRRFAEACDAVARPVATEEIPAAEALGRRLARPLTALRASPPTRCAAMDGIAVLAADTRSAPVVLGADSFEPVDTGAPVPARWDAMVVRERVRSLPDGSVEVLAAVMAGADIRPPGEDIAAGDELLAAGARMGPVEIAAAVAAGVASVVVERPARVAILPTGDEIVAAAGTPHASASVIDSNSPMLAALVRLTGAEPNTYAVVPDEPARMAQELRDAADADLILVVAGSSAGRRDHTADVLAAAGEIVVRGVAMTPGHPVVLAVAHGTPAIGLPGYPIAAAAAFHAFAAPLLARRQGHALPLVRARLADRLSARAVTRLVPVRVTGADAHPLPGKAGAIRAALGADGMVEVAPGRDLAAGDEVVVQLFRHAMGE